MNCVFCKIVNGDIPSYTIYEDDVVKCFLDINPESDGHALIIPKKHYKDLFDIPNDILIHIIDTARNLEKNFKDKLNIDGITLIQNNGNAQEVKHFHLHLKPYYDDSKLTDVKEIYERLK